MIAHQSIEIRRRNIAPDWHDLLFVLNTLNLQSQAAIRVVIVAAAAKSSSSLAAADMWSRWFKGDGIWRWFNAQSNNIPECHFIPPTTTKKVSIDYMAMVTAQRSNAKAFKVNLSCNHAAQETWISHNLGILLKTSGPRPWQSRCKSVRTKTHATIATGAIEHVWCWFRALSVRYFSAKNLFKKRVQFCFAIIFLTS